MIEHRQIAAIPTASRRPKSRIIGTLAKRRAAKAKIASNVTTSSAGPRLRAVSWIGCSLRSRNGLLLDARVHLDRVVDTDAEHHGQAGDRDDRQRDAEVARKTERPHHADEDHPQRQQSPAHLEQQEQDHDHDRDGDAAECEHPAAQVVVDVLEEHRRAGGDDGRVREVELVGLRLHELRRLALGLDRLVADEARDDLGMRRIEDERPVREPDVALVVVQEEVHPLGVVERPLVGRDGVDALERLCRRPRRARPVPAIRVAPSSTRSATRRPRCSPSDRRCRSARASRRTRRS